MSLAMPSSCLLGAKQLQRSLRAIVVGDAGGGAQGLQAIAAVLGDRHHAALVDAVGALGAVHQHLQTPAPHRRVELRPDDQRPVGHQQPLDRLDRHAGSGPGRRIAGRDFAGVGVAGLERRTLLAVDDRDLVARSRQVIGSAGADDAAAQHDDFHVLRRSWSWNGAHRIGRPQTICSGKLAADVLPHPACAAVRRAGRARRAGVRPGAAAQAFTFALIGDGPYGAGAVARFDRMLDEINADREVAFVLHAGDIKSASESCGDELLQARFAQLQRCACRWSTRRATTSGPTAT